MNKKYRVTLMSEERLCLEQLLALLLQPFDFLWLALVNSSRSFAL